MLKKICIISIVYTVFFAIKLQASPYTSLDFPEILTKPSSPETSKKIKTLVDQNKLSASYEITNLDDEQLAEVQVEIEGPVLKGSFSSLDSSLVEEHSDIERFLKHLELAAASSKCKVLRIFNDDSQDLSTLGKFGFSQKSDYFEKVIDLRDIKGFFIRNHMNKADKQMIEVDIGRKSKFLGNPFLIAHYTPDEIPESELKNYKMSDFDCLDPKQRDEVCELYKEYLHAENEVIRVQKKDRVQEFISSLARKHAYETKGKILGCYCVPDRCHGNTLFGFANNLEKEMQPLDCCDMEMRKQNKRKYDHIQFKEE